MGKKGEQIILRKRKTVISLLEEDTIAAVSEAEIKKGRELLEKGLLGR